MEGLEEFVEENGLHDGVIWSADEIGEIAPTISGYETNEIPGIETAIVFGNPLELGNQLDYIQGFDNEYGASGTCGLTSISNICKIHGMDVQEPEVVEYAMENDLCDKVEPGVLGGGITTIQAIKILEHYGIASHCEMADVATPERIAEAIEGGHGVIMGVNSGVLQDRDWKVYNEEGEIGVTHYVTVTGTVRDAETGELKGFYICDSSSARTDGGAIYTSLDEIEESYSKVYGGHVVMTNASIR